MIETPVFKKNKCSYLYNNFVSVSVLEMANISWRLDSPQTSQMLFGQTKVALLRFFLISNILPIIDQCKFIIFSWIGPDILMKLFENHIIFFIRAVYVLFNLYPRSCTGNSSFISFHEGIWLTTKTQKKNAALN